jgi:hypothetical protein
MSSTSAEGLDEREFRDTGALLLVDLTSAGAAIVDTAGAGMLTGATGRVVGAGDGLVDGTWLSMASARSFSVHAADAAGAAADPLIDEGLEEVEDGAVLAAAGLKKMRRRR